MSSTKAKKVQGHPTARLNFRLDPDIKARVVRAAAITGQEVTDFAVSTLNEKANQVIEQYNTIVLDGEQYEFFLAALDEDRKPSKRSKSAARRYRKGSRKGVRVHFAD